MFFQIVFHFVKEFAAEGVVCSFCVFAVLVKSPDDAPNVGEERGFVEVAVVHEFTSFRSAMGKVVKKVSGV